MSLDHSFDWKAFTFSAKILLVCVVAGVLGHFSLLYAARSNAAPVQSPSLILIQETHPAPRTSSLALSTTTSQRIINTLSISDAVPPVGKFVAADLITMVLTLYQDGIAIAKYPILTKGKPDSPYETPAGFYTVLTKEPDHFNAGEQIHMPWSMQFYGNYFIHGWPYFGNGSPVNSSYSGGCIRLNTDDAEKVYSFVDKGTGIFVYDPIRTVSTPSLVLGTTPAPAVSAASYLVADIDTGDVFLEQNAGDTRSIASVTKLMTALVANETIMFYKKIAVTRAEISHTQPKVPGAKEMFPVGELLYPLLMESNNAVADRLSEYYGAAGFINWMNATAKALDMQSTHFADASGISSENVSTTDDLFRLATYLANKKTFIFDITRTPTKKLISESGNVYPVENFNVFSDSANFIGGKVGKTAAAADTMVSVFSVPINGVARRVVIVVLKSDNYTTDTTALADWFTESVQEGATMSATACVTCAPPPVYRKIQQ